MFTRRTVVLPQNSSASSRPSPPVSEQEYRVLVINGSSEMAKEISLQLTINIPGCAIMYAPSLELARLILAKRQVDLVVSSTVLPDGGLSRLRSLLTSRTGSPVTKSPHVVLVGEAPDEVLDAFGGGQYQVSHVRRVRTAPSLPDNAFRSLRGKVLKRVSAPVVPIHHINSLGADLRNDLNNPLQEIVAMVFIARSATQSGTGTTTQALDAIDKAAKNMASVVRGLEDKIRDAILPNTCSRNVPAA